MYFFLLPTAEQGRPSVAFNPATQQYLITFQMSAPAFLGGVSVVVGQKVLAHQTDRFQNPFVLLKATGNGGVRVPALEPKIIYNSATGMYENNLYLRNVRGLLHQVFGCTQKVGRVRKKPRNSREKFLIF